MNKEEILNKYIDLIDKGYCSDCNELNCIDNFPHAKITHAIKELEQENQELKEQVDYLRRSIERKEEIIIDLQNERIPYTNEYVAKLENQQKYFIEYMNKTIEELECDDVGDEELKGYLIQEIDTFKEILLNYKSIMGVSKYKESGE